LFRERLFRAFYDWLDTNKQTIGTWYAALYDRAEKAEADCDTMMKIMANAMWMFNMIANLGVLAGVGPNKFDLQHLAPGIEERSSKRILMLISSALSLQGLPSDVMHQKMPIISSKNFSLRLFTDKS